MDLTSLVIWLVLGALAGIVAGRIMGAAPPFGLVGDIILGILGAFLGGFLLSLIGIAGTGGLIGSFLVAVLGAMLILWMARKIR